MRTTRQRERETDGQTYGHIRSNGPHWGPSEPSVGINTSQHWTPTLEINTNTIIIRFLKTTRYTDGRMYGWKYGQTDRRTYYTATQGVWTHGLRPHVLRTITALTLLSPKRIADKQIYIKRDVHIDGWTYIIYWTPLGSFRSQCGDKCIATLDPHTGN